MIPEIRNILKKRKAKIFLISLLCSSLIWFLSKLSETYTNNATFNLEFHNIPDSLSLNKVSKKQVDVRLRANGFQFLSFNVKNKQVGIDLSSVTLLKGRYYIPPDIYRKQIDKQLRSMTVLDIDNDTLFFKFTQLGTKIVPVNPQLDISLLQNHILNGPLSIEPKEITIKGAVDIIDTINRVNTVSMELSEISSDFTKEMALYKSPGLGNITYSSDRVVIHGKVTRFSEKVVEVPIKVINLPQKYKIRIFPNKVGILCKGTLGELKLLDSTSFEVIADYNSTINNDESKTIGLKLLKKTGTLQSAKLNEKEVEFILRKQ